MSHLSDGHLVELRTSPLDWRDYGDKEAIHNGNILDWWNGMDWQTVRYESAGRAHAFIEIDVDTNRTRDHDTTLRPRSSTAWRFFGLNGRHVPKAR